MNAVDRQAKK